MPLSAVAERVISADFLEVFFILQAKCPAKQKLCMKMCWKSHKTQKKCVKICKIKIKEVIFTVLQSKAIILRRLWKILCRRASVCLPLLETLDLCCF